MWLELSLQWGPTVRGLSVWLGSGLRWGLEPRPRWGWGLSHDLAWAAASARCPLVLWSRVRLRQLNSLPPWIEAFLAGTQQLLPGGEAVPTSHIPTPAWAGARERWVSRGCLLGPASHLSHSHRQQEAAPCSYLKLHLMSTPAPGRWQRRSPGRQEEPGPLWACTWLGLSHASRAGKPGAGQELPETPLACPVLSSDGSNRPGMCGILVAPGGW